MNRFLRLFRFGNGLMGAFGALIACFIAAGRDITDCWVDVLLGCVLVISFVAGGNSLNDYIDRDIDKTAHPDRPLPTGELQPRTAEICGIAGLAVSVAISFLISLETVAVVVIAAAMMVAYETVLKQRGFVGNLCIALLTGAVFVFGGAVVDDFSHVWIIAILAMLVSIGREISKDIEDENSDKGSRWTLPMAVGNRNAAIIAAVFFVLGPLLSFIPLVDGTFGTLYCTVIIADAIFIYCAITVFKDAHKAEKMAKIAMLVALVAFILGVI